MPNVGTVQECNTSADVIKNKIVAFVGNTKRLSTSNEWYKGASSLS